MQQWLIPAKTFLLGEYAALQNGRAILLTTSPCFEIKVSETLGFSGVHLESPAGKLWSHYGINEYGLTWHDPYAGCGGLGASSAQFLGAYFAITAQRGQKSNVQELLELFWRFAWNGTGIRPSGYDIIAQSLSNCVFINGTDAPSNNSPWPFEDLGFIIVHTGNKLPTHLHLQQTPPIKEIDTLNQLVIQAEDSFQSNNSLGLISAVNSYYQSLLQMQLVSVNTQRIITDLASENIILAAKGCGAMGEDTILVLLDKRNFDSVTELFHNKKLKILATNNNLFQNLITSNS